MARQVINLGALPQGVGGDTPRSANTKINDMTLELYAGLAGLVPVTSPTDRTAGRLLTPGSGGILGVPVAISNANNITFLGGTHGTFTGTESQCVSANYPALGGAGTENRRWYIDTDFIDGTSARQTAMESLGVGTLKGRMFTRVLATTWQQWVEVYTSGNALLDPQTAGGLMSSSVVSGWIIEKFLNGTLIMSGTSVTSTLPASQVTGHTFAVPAGIISADSAVLAVNATPSGSTDFSVNYANMNSATAGAIVFRNGPVAQTASLRIKIIARWKT